MTPERNEPNTNPMWQSTSTDSAEWDDTLDPFDDIPRQTNALGDDASAFPAEGDTGHEDYNDADALSTSFLSRSELLRQMGQQFSPILVPLLFAGLTLVCILPFVLNGRAIVSLNHFWPIGLVIIALAILQGMGLYYASSNNVYWTMGVVGGFFLFLLIGCFTIFGPLPTVVLLIVLLALSVLGMRTSMRPVKEGTVVIVSSSGKYTRTLFPGLNFLLPWERVETTVSTREVQWPCPEQQVRISREEDVLLHARISYQLEPDDAHIAALEVEKWEESLRELFRAALQTVAGELTPEDFLGWSKGFRSRQPLNDQQLPGNASRWERINALLYQRMRDKVAQWGVQINWIQVYDILLVPHVAPPADLANMAARTANGRSPAGSMPPAQSPPVAKQTGATGTAQEATPPPTVKELKGMIGAYNSVKNGMITDPTNIRNIAARFEAIANDAEVSQLAEFDAARAARNLYAQANVIEEQMKRASLSPGFNDVTQPDWNMRRPTDDNLMAGG